MEVSCGFDLSAWICLKKLEHCRSSLKKGLEILLELGLYSWSYAIEKLKLREALKSVDVCMHDYIV